MKNIAQRLLEERQRLGYSQQYLAQAGGVTTREQRQYELGEDLPHADYLAALAEHGVDVVYVSGFGLLPVTGVLGGPVHCGTGECIQ